MMLVEAMAQNGSAQISGQSKQDFLGRYPHVKFIIAREVFNPNEQDFPTRGYVAPGKYKVIRAASDPRDPKAGIEEDVLEAYSDLISCERLVESELRDYNPNGWGPSRGRIIHEYVRTSAFED